MIQKKERAGAAVVEMAAVVAIFCMFLFGIIEYGRFVYYRNLVLNATREGARYAVVNIYDTTMVTDTQAYVKKYLAGLDTKLGSYACNVYWSDASGTNIGAAGSAPFGSYICVQIKGDYSPVLPTFLRTKSTIPIDTKTIMCSEAN